MILIRGLQELYSRTIDRSKFREISTRVIVFVLPLFFLGREPWWEGLAVALVGVLIRAWAAGHLHKDQKMAQGGPYLFVRHPLYLGSCLLAAGLIITVHHWFVTLVLGGLTVLTYVHTIRHEEKNLRARFGRDYDNFSRTAGPLWPKGFGIHAARQLFSADSPKFSAKQYLKNKEYECLLGVVAVFALLYLGSISRF
jgi:hypothetical protein